MDDMIKEMIEQFISDLEKGKIFGLQLIRSENDAVKRNCYADIYQTVREIVGFDNEKFYLRTRLSDPYYLQGSTNGSDYCLPDYSIPSDEWYNAEAYFSAFDYYDGNTLRSIQKFPAAVIEKDSVVVTEYKVIRSY